MSSLFAFYSLPSAFWSPGPAEMMLLAIVALLLYGGNLPEVARSWGKTLAEFRRSLTGIQNEINDVIYSDPEQLEYHGDDAYDSPGYNAQGYDDAYSDDADDAEPDAAADESFDSEKTVRNSSKDTVVIEDEVKPTEDQPTD